jgi:tellurite resistance protein
MSQTNPPSQRTIDEPKLEALVELMFLAAFADGEFSEKERGHFLGSVESLTDRRVSRDSLDKLLARIEADLKASSREARLATVKERLGTSPLRKVGLSLAVQVMAADGIIRTSERELLLEVAEALDVDRDEAADLVSQLSP